MNAHAKHAQFTKFSPVTIETKKRLKAARKIAGFNMQQAAVALGMTRKTLEDLETLRNYGSHVELEVLCKASQVYKVSIASLIGDLPGLVTESQYYERPRKRRGSRSR